MQRLSRKIILQFSFLTCHLYLHFSYLEKLFHVYVFIVKTSLALSFVTFFACLKTKYSLWTFMQIYKVMLSFFAFKPINKNYYFYFGLYVAQKFCSHYAKMTKF